MGDDIKLRKEFEAWFLALDRDFTRESLSTTQGRYFYTTTEALWQMWQQLETERARVRVLREVLEAVLSNGYWDKNQWAIPHRAKNLVDEALATTAPEAGDTDARP